MTLPTPVLPPSGRFIQCIRESSQALVQAEAVTISDTNIERLLLSPAFTETYHRISASSNGLALPLNFPSPLSELNLLSILGLLNTASGYRVPLHQETGRGAWDSMCALVFGLYLSSATDGEGDLMSARGMQVLGEAKLAELLGVSLHTERPHDTIQGLTVGQIGGPGWELVQLLKTLLNETGKVLVDGGYPNLGSFVAEALKEGEKVAREKGDPTAAAEVVLERLVRAIPGFRDMATINDQPVYCFKKALCLIHDVATRFGAKKEKDPSPFPVLQTSHLPVFADNVIPSILVHIGIIDLSSTSTTTTSPTLANIFPGAGTDETKLLALFAAAAAPSIRRTEIPSLVPVDGPVLTLTQSYVMRAAAIEACDRIVARAHAMSDQVADPEQSGGDGKLSRLKKITVPVLDRCLKAMAKDRADYRELPRFVLRNTPFF